MIDSHAVRATTTGSKTSTKLAKVAPMAKWTFEEKIRRLSGWGNNAEVMLKRLAEVKFDISRQCSVDHWGGCEGVTLDE